MHLKGTWNKCNFKGEKEGSLFHSVDYTFTPAGKRKLLNDLENPLYSVERINLVNLVEFFFKTTI